MVVNQSPAGKPRVLLAPVTVTPTKPLTPSHLKGLFWTDVMYRATSRLATVTYRYSHTTYDITEQTLAFWEFLDRSHGDIDYPQLNEDDIGKLYMAYRSQTQRASADALRAYAEAVERQGWTHPASARMLELWTDQYARLGLHDPGLLAHQPPGLSTDEVIAQLAAAGMCLDLRGHGGAVYLDATRHGLPLRQIVGADGRPNYIACALRELLPLAPAFDEVVLLYDHELDPDYQLLQRVLAAVAPAVRRVVLRRIPIDGAVRSARHGGWEGCDARALLELVEGRHEPAAIRLGMRLYFIAMLGPGQQPSFRADLLRQCVVRAERLLAATPGDDLDLVEMLGRHRSDHLFVDPYRLTSSLMSKRQPAPSHALLAGVFL